MITLTQTPVPISCSTLFLLKKPPLNLKPFYNPTHYRILNKVTTTGLSFRIFFKLLIFCFLFQRKMKLKHRGTCRAEFSDDAPFVIAIGTCMLSSLVLASPAGKEEDADSVLDSTTDSRFAVMGIISFIPYFNWLVSGELFFFFKYILVRLFNFFNPFFLFPELGFCVA